MPERLYTVYQVADLLGAVPSHVIGWVQRGWLSSCPGAPRDPIRVSQSALVGFLKSRGIDLEKAMARAALAEDRGRPAAEASAPAGGTSGVRPPTTTPEDVSHSLAPAGPGASEPAPRTFAASTLAPAGPGASAGRADAEQDLAEAILREAVARRARAVHLEPAREGLAVRFRADGVLQDKVNFRVRLPAAVAPRLIGHLLRAAGLPDAAPQAPLAGRFEAIVEGRTVEFLLAACPTRDGASLVLHVRDREAPPQRLTDLGLDEDEEAAIRGLLARPCGLIVATSPPRRGAGTLLRAMLTELADPHKGLWAVQRPEGIGGEGVHVVEVAPDSAGGFAAAIRAAAAQDPDVLFIGQVRQPTAARAALEAAEGGALVLARMFCPTAPEAAALLLDMGLDPWALTSGLLAVTASSSVRRLSPEGPGSSPRAHLRDGALVAERLSDLPYAGRLILTSTMPVDRRLAGALRAGGDLEALRQAARNGGVRSLRERGLARVQAGRTSLEELRRAGLEE